MLRTNLNKANQVKLLLRNDLNRLPIPVMSLNSKVLFLWAIPPPLTFDYY